MKLCEIVNAPRPPVPWQEGDNIPWNEPGFSRRMLNEHLSQAHDAASRRSERIDGHVGWIASLLEPGATVLDLGCGPGLYTNRLARLGHRCRGIDFGPASVAYANETAAKEGLSAVHTLGDVRTTPFGESYDLVMCLYGELNVFRRDQAEELLRRAHGALKPGGQLLLEPQTLAGVRAQGREPRHWTPQASGLFAEEPHLYLVEPFWDQRERVSTIRHIVITESEVRRYAASYAAYTDEEYIALLERCGFTGVQFLPGLGGAPRQYGLMAILATRG